MASGSSEDLNGDCKKMFMLCAERCAGKELPNAEKSEGKSNVVNKLLKETFDPKIANIVDATIFCKYCDKKTKKLTVDQFLNNVLPDLAINQVIEKKKSKSPTPDDPAVQEELNLLKTKISTKYREWISADNKPKDSAVVQRLTDVKGYTGAHKERFDAETGKGKGAEGREERADNTGYVGGYKGAGTYDKTH